MGTPSAKGARIEAPKAQRWVGSGEFFFDFLSGNGAFWCILGACFNVSIRRVKQS